jgi:hypothetical protein
MTRLFLLAALAALVLAGGYVYLARELRVPQGPDAVAGEPAHETERAVFEGFELTLSAPKGACRLRFGNAQAEGAVDLDIPPPCRFMRDGDGRPQFFAEGGRRLIAVVGGELTEDPADPLTSRPDCGHAMAGVAFSDGAFVKTGYTMGPGVFCARMGLEQREIWLLLNG